MSAPFLHTIPRGKKIAAVNVTDSAVVLPTVGCQMFMLQALAGNTGSVYYGESDVSATTGIALTAGTMSPWIPCENLDEYYVIAGTTGDDVIYHCIT